MYRSSVRTQVPIPSGIKIDGISQVLAASAVGVAQNPYTARST